MADNLSFRESLPAIFHTQVAFVTKWEYGLIMTAALLTGPAVAGPEPDDVARSLRIRRRWRALGIVSVLIAGVVVVVVVMSNARLLSNALRSATGASPWWLLVTGLAVALSFLAAAVGIAGAVQGQVPVGRTVAAELAGAFCNRLTPAGVGRTALRARYLVCAGLTVERAASAVALSSIVGAVAYLGGMAAAGVAMQDGSAASMAVSPGGVAIYCCSVLLLVCLAVESSSLRWRRSERRRRWTARARILGNELRSLCKDPLAMTALIAGPLVASAAYVIAFWAALHSIGADIGLTSAALVYVTATSVATAVPVPGGVGAAEITLTAGLTTAGISPGTALSGVLIFRLVSLWLPSAAGACTLLWLRRIGALSTGMEAAPLPAPTRSHRLVSPDGRRYRQLTPKKVVIAGSAVAAVAMVGTGVALVLPEATFVIAPTSSSGS